MTLLEKAIQIATQAHAGQIDRVGQPYIMHPLRVMHNGGNEIEKICGVLHDVIEDTPWTFEMLTAEGFPNEIIEVLKCVTKISDDENYDEFVERTKQNKTAIKVKLNDLTDNLDLRRLKQITEADIPRINKYLKAYHYLNTLNPEK